MLKIWLSKRSQQVTTHSLYTLVWPVFILNSAWFTIDKKNPSKHQNNLERHLSNGILFLTNFYNSTSSLADWNVCCTPCFNKAERLSKQPDTTWPSCRKAINTKTPNPPRNSYSQSCTIWTFYARINQKHSAQSRRVRSYRYWNHLKPVKAKIKWRNWWWWSGLSRKDTNFERLIWSIYDY